MSPHTPEKTGTCHTDKQWKVGGGDGWKKRLNAPHKMLLLPATPINKLDNAKHKETNSWANITKPLNNLLQSLPVVNSVKLDLTSFKPFRLQPARADFTLSNAIQFYLLRGDPQGRKG